jgi:deoxycytidine triphosphate deaminase
VLSAGRIQRLVEQDKTLIVAGYSRTSLQPASYNVTIAETGLITPHGKRIPPPTQPAKGKDAKNGQGVLERRQKGEPAANPQGGAGDEPAMVDAAEADAQGRLARLIEERPRLTPPPVLLEPGDTAVFSSRERFELPAGIAGNVTVKNSYATRGLMLLSGMLVDPGYGTKDAHGDGRPGCPLYLHVANIGRERMTLIPGYHDIARIQFLHVDSVPDEKQKAVPGSRWDEQKLVSLGFLSDLKELKENVERTDNRTQLVLGGGVAVILVALIGAALSSILSIATDKELTGDLHSTWGSLSLAHSVIWAALIVGIPILCVAIVLGYSKLAAWRQRLRRLKKPPT